MIDPHTPHRDNPLSRIMCDKSDEKTNTGEGDKDKRNRTVSDDVGGKSLSETSKSVCGQCFSW
jgi:hypothetical protein